MIPGIRHRALEVYYYYYYYYQDLILPIVINFYVSCVIILNCLEFVIPYLLFRYLILVNSFTMSVDRRESIDRRPGAEGKNVLKGSRKGQTIAIFTSGGDSQGMFTRQMISRTPKNHNSQPNLPLVLP